MSAESIDVLSLLIEGLDQVDCREIVEAAVGYRVCRLHLGPDGISAAMSWARQYELFAEQSDFVVEEVDADEGKGQWTNLGQLSDRSEGPRFLYLGRSREDVLKAKDAEAEDDATALGELLRIPACCIQFYERHRSEALRKYADDYAPITTRLTAKPPPYDWRLNYLAQYFGHNLIHHFPCNWHCEASLRRAQDSLEIVRTVSSIWARRLERELRGVVVFENQLGVHMIKKPPEAPEFAYRRDQVVSTASTPLSGLLRKHERLEFDASYQVTGPPGVPEASQSGTLVLAFR